MLNLWSLQGIGEAETVGIPTCTACESLPICGSESLKCYKSHHQSGMYTQIWLWNQKCGLDTLAFFYGNMAIFDKYISTSSK